MTPRGRLVTLAAISLLVTGNTIRRMLFLGIKPFDWLMLAVDVLVLGLILYEVIAGEWRHSRDRKLQRRRADVVTTLSGFMEKGQKLLTRVPCPELAKKLEVDLWQVEAQSWSKEVGEFLSGISPRALTAFRIIPGTGVMAQGVYAESGASFMIDGPLRHSHQRLVSHLENLRGITEKPEAYF